MFAPIHITSTSGTAPAVSGPVASGGGPAVVDEQPQPKKKDRAVVPNPVPPQNPPPDPNKDKAPPPDRPKDPPAALAPWTAQPDPLPAGLTLADNPQGAIPITGVRPLPNILVDQVVFPTSPSPFVSVAVKGAIHDAHEVWDLRTMKRVGVVIDPKDPFSIASLSPNGDYFAVPSFGLNPDKGADVYNVATGRLYLVKVTKESVFIDNIDFGGPGEVLTLRGAATADGIGVLVQAWTITTGALARQFTAPALLDPKLRAFSPTRRYMALAAAKNERVMLYDLPTGSLAGEAPLPADSACQGIAFSSDGNRVACLFKTGAVTRLRTWDMGNGFQAGDFTFDKAPVANVAAFRGPAIDYLPQSGSWLLYGQAPSSTTRAGRSTCASPSKAPTRPSRDASSAMAGWPMSRTSGASASWYSSHCRRTSSRPCRRRPVPAVESAALSAGLQCPCRTRVREGAPWRPFRR